MFKTFLALAALAAAVSASEEKELSTPSSSKLYGLCSAAADCDRGMQCRAGHCECAPDHFIWHGGCLPVKAHGERCSQQAECSASSDINLHCVEDPKAKKTGRVGGDSPVRKRCQCRAGHKLHPESGKCLDEGDVAFRFVHHGNASPRTAHPPHIGLKKMQPPPESDVASMDIVQIEDNLNDIYYGAKERPRLTPTARTKVIGPVAIMGAVVLLFVTCICCWSVKNNDLVRREDAYRTGHGGPGQDDGPSDAEAPTYRPAKAMEDGLSVGPGMMVTGGQSGMSGEDNAAFPTGDPDALSHFTTQTEVCDASHAEYLERNSNSSGGRAAVPAMGTEVLQRNEAAAAGDAGYDHNIKMIFKHSQEISLTPSMDDADAEVAGIYKTFSSNVDPLAARIANLPTPPPAAAVATDGKGKARVIELVETDDCTSIDTTIPEDEVAQFQRGLERQKELNLDDSIAEETEEEVSKHNGLDDDTNTAVDTPRTAECTEFVDNVFKPVFSIS